ncbi:unnamed protein product [Arctia plantaginis]|uniref:Uncharacterized protein n=1 Tax=Arctia plantaginis TaxID=874455 RepID=A0A8S0Z2V6_ARCPL|nr:unnamed protein product [Arctia plantaginis]
MLKLTYTILSVTWLVTTSYAALAPFIQKCKWDDRACLLKSSQTAIPYFAAGVSELGMSPLDPVALNTVSYNEGGLKITFKDMILSGTRNCQVKDVERNKDEQWLKFEVECPIQVHGNYITSGNLFNIPVEGSGPFSVKTDKLFILLKCRLVPVDGEDGQKYWKLNNDVHTYEFQSKTLLKFENLFNGDTEKAAPIMTILEESWKEVVQTFGKPIVSEVLNRIVSHLDVFFKAVPISELEI